MIKINLVTLHGLNRNTEVRNSRLNCRTVGLLAAGILLCSSIQFANAAAGGQSKNSPFVEINGELVTIQGAVTSLQDQITFRLFVNLLAVVVYYISTSRPLHNA